jgi:choline-sulfatase
MNRRDFLKLAGAAAPAFLFPGAMPKLRAPHRQGSQPNVLILLFDSLTSRNLSLYGYPRSTSPNFERFAQRAAVYHWHYAAGNFTIPGTASLLSGTYPWTNRALNHSGVIKRALAENNIFRAFGSDYYRVTFPQSVWANFIVTQFANDLDQILPSGSFGEVSYLLNDFFAHDQNLAARALDDFVFVPNEVPASLLLGSLYKALYGRDSAQVNSAGYPRGVPRNVNYPYQFRLEGLTDGLISFLQTLESPFIAYLHLFPPHAPYRASEKFYGAFVDNFKPPRKPQHRFSDKLSNADLGDARRSYDEYIASLDWEFGRLMDALDSAGIFDTSYVIVTSDHGEMFERGEKAHSTPLLFDPVVHIPLLVSAPGQTARKDIFTPTSAVDVLPTLTQLIGKPIPDWSEGSVLPGLGGDADDARSIFVVEAKLNSAFAPLTKATVAMRKGNYKLIYYTGYEAEDSFELYDLGEDVEELEDLYPAKPSFAALLEEELLESLFEANKPYRK